MSLFDLFFGNPPQYVEPSEPLGTTGLLGTFASQSGNLQPGVLGEMAEEDTSPTDAQVIMLIAV